jgi:glycosyltransferase involved in cell wall biosynthesis
VVKVVHVLSGLYQGGAESQLEKIILFSKGTDIKHYVVSLKSDETPLVKRFKENDIPVYCMGFDDVFSSIRGFFRLRRCLKLLVSDDSVIQCWMYHANFVGLLVAKSLGLSQKVVWNIRRTELPKGLTGLLARVSAKLSYIFPVKIVCCAETAKNTHIEAGYNSKNILVIHNGINAKLFRPNDVYRAKFRNEILVADDEFVIGMVGRYSPIKGHIYLLKAFEKLLNNNKGRAIKLVLVGRDIDNAEPLQEILSYPHIQDNLILLSERSDMSKVMTGFDILCLPSLSEGFPNVVAEAMAVGIPCVATDVGDSALIIGEYGYLVEPKDDVALVVGIESLLEMPELERREMGQKARKYIEDEFTLSVTVRQYMDLYKTIILDQRIR